MVCTFANDNFYEGATEAFVERFEDLRLITVLEFAEESERSLAAAGNLRDARVMAKIVSIIRRNLPALS